MVLAALLEAGERSVRADGSIKMKVSALCLAKVVALIPFRSIELSSIINISLKMSDLLVPPVSLYSLAAVGEPSERRTRLFGISTRVSTISLKDRLRTPVLILRSKSIRTGDRLSPV